jgi:uncharacterized protein YbjT (DUF2867 family)
MKILLLGASGLIGSALLKALDQQGYCVKAISKSFLEGNTVAEYMALDVAQYTAHEDWAELLRGTDVVINTVGIFAENALQSFAALHVAMPKALFAACERAQIRVIHVSALGAHPQAATEYWRSKGEAEAELMQRQCDWAIVRPSLIYAPQGRSCRQFLMLATCPVLPDFAGSAEVQPVHLDDVVATIMALLTAPSQLAQRIDVVGPSAYRLVDWLAAMRQAMGLPSGKRIRVSAWVQDISAQLAQYLPGSLWSPASLAMLRTGNCADGSAMQALLQRPTQAALPATEQVGLAARAQLDWLLPIMRFSLALVWLLTAAVCWWGWPHVQSLALLAQVGVQASWQWPMFVGAIGLDAALGVACLLNRRCWRWQALLVLGYSLVIAMALPQYLLHPFGPVLKNLPILALLLVLDQCERGRR